MTSTASNSELVLFLLRVAGAAMESSHLPPEQQQVLSGDNQLREMLAASMALKKEAEEEKMVNTMLCVCSNVLLMLHFRCFKRR